MHANSIIVLLFCLMLFPATPGVASASQGEVAEIEALIHRADVAVDSDPRKALRLAEEAFARLEREPNVELRARAGRHAVLALVRLSLYRDCLKLGEEILAEARAAGVETADVGYIMTEVGFAYQAISDLGSAFVKYSEANKVFSKLGDEAGLFYVSDMFALLFALAGRFDDAVEFYEETNDIAARMTLGENLGLVPYVNAMTNYAWVLVQAGRPAEALALMQKVLPAAEESASPVVTAYVEQSLGDALLALERYDDARAYFMRALEKVSQRGMSQQVNLIDLQLAKIDFHQGKPAQARKRVIAALSSMEQNDQTHSLLQAHDFLFELAKAEGPTQSALHHLETYMRYKDEFINEQTANNMSLLRAEFELDNKEQAIAILQRDAQIQSLRLGRETAYRNFAIFGMAVLIAIAAGLALGLQANIRAKRTIRIKAEALAAAREELQKTNAELERVSQLKSDFLSMTSHELRTPLNGVMGMVQMLETRELDHEQRHYLDVIRDSGELMLAMLNDILDLAKIEAGKLDINQKPFQLESLITSVSSLWSPKARERGLAFAVETDAAAPQSLIGDAHRIQQVLNNFTSNALKFTTEGGVTIRVSVRPHQEHESARLCFEVEDTGVGISKEKQSKLFRAFSQADSDTAEHYGGTGLGLAICLKLVRLMKGEIGVHSVAGKGSTFWFELPFQIEGAVKDLAANVSSKAA